VSEQIKLDITSGIGVLTLSRPESFNSFHAAMIGNLAEKLIRLYSNDDILGVVLTGEGKAFCTGADLKWLSGCGMAPGAALHGLAALYHQAISEIRRMPKPVVAAVNGLAAGGGFSMALACDFRVMARSAVFRQAYTSNGLSIDGGGTYTLPRLVGLAKAMEIAALDRPISADQALIWGLATEVVEDGQAVDRAVAMVREIVERPLSSFQASKKLLTDSFHTSFEHQLEREREFLSWAADHPNGLEGIKAFVEKRKPVYNRRERGAQSREGNTPTTVLPSPQQEVTSDE
jgi:2-(1,2-epoxy-1,2-dihydrophenyl)acetyl-CoA isomerase